MPPPKTFLDVVVRDEGRWELKFSPNPSFVAYVTKTVPARWRSYNEETGDFTLTNKKWVDRVARRGKKHFTFVTEILVKEDGSKVFFNLRTKATQIQGALF